MNWKYMTLFLVSITLTTLSFGQGFHLGVKGGANIFKVDGKSFNQEFQFGYNAGAFAEINFNKHIGIQPEVLWNQTNFRTGDQFKDIYPQAPSDLKGSLNYLSIPILFSYRPVKFFSFQVGPQYGILINKHETVLQNGKDAFKSGDFSMLGGVQFNLGGVKVGGRYQIGLANINDIDNQDKWKNQGFQVYAGFRFF
jgi:hypothetical protein